MVKTYSDKKNIYSVDMMFSYVNNFKHKTVNVQIKDLLFNLDFKGWYSDELGSYAPVDVIDNPKKYPEEVKRIKNADLKYPIMLHDNYIVDGVHRTIKAMLQGKKTIKAYQFPTKLMKKFLINSTGNWKEAIKIEPYELIDLFHKRFAK